MKKIKIELSLQKKFPFVNLNKRKEKTLSQKIKILTFYVISLISLIIFIVGVSGWTFYQNYYSNFIRNNKNAVNNTKKYILTVQLGSGHIIYTGNNKMLQIGIKRIESKLNLKHIFQYNNMKNNVKICLFKSNKILMNNPSETNADEYTGSFLSSFKKFVKGDLFFVDGLAMKKYAFHTYGINDSDCDYAIILFKFANTKTLYHEFGHIIDYYSVDNNSQYKQERKKIWEKYFKESGKFDFVRKYGSTNSYEDFATIIASYLNGENIYNRTYLLNKKIEFLKKYFLK